jgi:glycosyltransferase involved in cell wall biosynthesis
MNKGKVRFLPKVSHSETADYYNRAGVCLNATPTGSLDKTVLEAMACETPVLVSNSSYCGSIPDIFLFEEGNAGHLADKIEKIFSLSDDERRRYGAQLRRYVIEHHSLAALVKEIERCVQ